MINKMMFVCYILLAGCIAIFFVSFNYMVTSSYLNSPAIMPQVIAVVTCLFCVIELVKSYKEKQRLFPQGLRPAVMLRAAVSFFKINRKVWIAIGLSLLYVFGMKTLGFLLITFIYFVAMLLNLDTNVRHLPKGALIAAVFTAAVYFIFTYAFSANLPSGTLFS